MNRVCGKDGAKKMWEERGREGRKEKKKITLVSHCGLNHCPSYLKIRNIPEDKPGGDTGSVCKNYVYSADAH